MEDSWDIIDGIERFACSGVIARWGVMLTLQVGRV